jgi:hypothetical protein
MTVKIFNVKHLYFPLGKNSVGSKSCLGSIFNPYIKRHFSYHNFYDRSSRFSVDLSMHESHLAKRSFPLLPPTSICIIKRTMIASVRKGHYYMEVVKGTFLRICGRLEKLTNEQIINDAYVMADVKSLVDMDDAMCTRAYQLALEVVFSGRNFDRKALIALFDKRISFEDAWGNNNQSDVDQSTFYNGIVVEQMLKRHPNWSVSVCETPTTRFNKNDLSSKVQRELQTNQFLTGNTFPDVSIDGIPYDVKSVKNISNTKNHVYVLLDCPEAYATVKKHFNDLSVILQRETQYPGLSKEYQTILLKKIEYFKTQIEAHPSTMKQVMIHWDEFLIKTSSQRPPNFGVPLFIVTQPFTIDPNVDVNSVPLPEGNFDSTKTKVAIDGIVESGLLSKSKYDALRKKMPPSDTNNNKDEVD